MIALYDPYQIELARWWNGVLIKGPKLKFHRFGEYCLGGLGPLIKNDLIMLKEMQMRFEELL